MPMLPKWQSLKWPFLFDVGLFGCSGWLYLRESLIPSVSILGFTIGILFWQIVLVLRGRHNADSFTVQANVQSPHYFQAFIQLCHYGYWGLYWPAVGDWAPLIVPQLLFAYALESLLAWSRQRPWRIGFGPLPIVLSINLFLWFKEEYFYLQLLLIAAAFLAKAFITWTRDGKKTHIFNPSGFALALAALALMFTENVGLTIGVDLIGSFFLPPNFFELMFLLGIVLQFFFATTLVTFGATLSLSALHFGVSYVLGVLIAPSPIDIAVFLGINLLITDPSTSPKSNIGKFLFGLAYGVGIFVAYAILRQLSQPSYFDKILVVPILNLAAIRFDVLGKQIYDQTAEKWRTWRALGSRPLHLGLYVVLFLAILPSLKHRDRAAIDPFPPVAFKLSGPMLELHAKVVAVRIAYRDVYKSFGFLAEAIYFDANREINRDTAESHTRIGEAFLMLGVHDRAIPHFQRAIQINPAYTKARDYLSYTLESMRRRAESVAE